MKLDHDCMRDVLLFVESVPYVAVNPLGDMYLSEIDFKTICDALPQWSNTIIYYAVFNLAQGGYIDATIQYGDDIIGNCCVNYMTLHGHEFLDSIRDEARWGKVKTIVGTVKDYSLAALSFIAEGVTAGAVTAYLQKHP